MPAIRATRYHDRPHYRSSWASLAPTGERNQLWERGLPTRQGRRGTKTDRISFIVGKPRSNRRMRSTVGAWLARDKGDAVPRQTALSFIVGKPRSNRRTQSTVGAWLARDKGDAVSRQTALSFIAGRPCSNRRTRSTVGAWLARDKGDAVSRQTASIHIPPIPPLLDQLPYRLRAK